MTSLEKTIKGKPTGKSVICFKVVGGLSKIPWLSRFSKPPATPCNRKSSCCESYLCDFEETSYDFKEIPGWLKPCTKNMKIEFPSQVKKNTLKHLVNTFSKYFPLTEYPLRISQRWKTVPYRGHMRGIRANDGGNWNKAIIDQSSVPSPSSVVIPNSLVINSQEKTLRFSSSSSRFDPFSGASVMVNKGKLLFLWHRNYLDQSLSWGTRWICNWKSRTIG